MFLITLLRLDSHLREDLSMPSMEKTEAYHSRLLLESDRGRDEPCGISLYSPFFLVYHDQG
jgi:hypothetical protein